MHYENLFAFLHTAIDCMKISPPVQEWLSKELPRLTYRLLMLINSLPYSTSQTTSLYLLSN